jgi:low temperature requirement protein LtrA
MATPRADADERVTYLELFFDLVFVFAFTPVTGLMAKEEGWPGIGQGLLVLAALWWAWAGYAWLTNRVNPEEGGVRLAFFAAMAALLLASLAVPRAFAADAEVFGVAYLVVRGMHIALFALGAGSDLRIRTVVRRLAGPRLLGVGALLALIPLVHAVDALPALSIVAATCCGLIAYEALRFRDTRDRVRHAQEIAVSP